MSKLVWSLFLFTSSLFASASNLYVAQNATGTGNGGSCSNAFAVSFFNNPANWGSTSLQIGAGTTVHLCGTFTFPANSTGLTVQGSGTSGSPITIVFEPGAVLQSPYFLWAAPAFGCRGNPCGGAIDVFNQNYITIDGQGTGVIQNTANGSSLTNQQASTGVYLSGDHILVKKLTVRNIYVNSSAESTAKPGFNSADVRVDNAATNTTVCNSTLAGAHVGIWSDSSQGIYVSGPSGCTETQASSGINFYGNAISDHGWMINANGSGYVNIYDNDVTDWSNWFFPVGAGAYHLDGIITFSDGPSIMHTYVYNNFIHGDITNSSPTGFVFCTYGGSGSGSACTIFNNVFYGTGAMATGHSALIYFHSANGNPLGPHAVYNNTLINGSFGWDMDGDTTTQYSWKNNIFLGASNGSTWFFHQESTSQPFSTLSATDNNVYFQGRAFPWNWSGTAFSSLSSWQSSCHCDTAATTGNPTLDANFSPQSGSSAIGEGANLTSLGIPPLNLDKNGSPRPASGAWDAGAYQFSGIAPPPPPPPTTYTLTVVSGTGGGNYTASTIVTVTALAPPAGQVFLNWTGATVANPASPTTTLVMPAANATVTANYTSSPPPPAVHPTCSVSFVGRSTVIGPDGVQMVVAPSRANVSGKITWTATGSVCP